MASNDPHIPDEIQADLLDKVVRNSLRTLPEGLADLVGRHLAAAQVALADDPALALAHAQAAVRRAGRVAVVREAAGVAAYAAGDFGTARNELRAAARISGIPDYLPMLADCERGLGKPEKALELASAPEAERLDASGKVEMLIVAAGARRDLGQDEAAVLTLQVPALQARTAAPWLPRLRYAYADALLGAGRPAEARAWFVRAAQVDPERLTDAVERVDEIDGIAYEEIEELETIEDSAAGESSHDGQRVAQIVWATAEQGVGLPVQPVSADAEHGASGSVGAGPGDPASVPAGPASAEAAGDRAESSDDRPEGPPDGRHGV